MASPPGGSQSVTLRQGTTGQPASRQSCGARAGVEPRSPRPDDGSDKSPPHTAPSGIDQLSSDQALATGATKPCRGFVRDPPSIHR